MANERNAPLEIKVDGGKLVISIGVETLAYAAENDQVLERYHEGEDYFDTPTVMNTDAFAKDVLSELVDEDHNTGENMVQVMLTSAMQSAMENGSEFIVYESDK